MFDPDSSGVAGFIKRKIEQWRRPGYSCATVKLMDSRLLGVGTKYWALLKFLCMMLVLLAFQKYCPWLSQVL